MLLLGNKNVKLLDYFRRGREPRGTSGVNYSVTGVEGVSRAVCGGKGGSISETTAGMTYCWQGGGVGNISNGKKRRVALTGRLLRKGDEGDSK